MRSEVSTKKVAERGVLTSQVSKLTPQLFQCETFFLGRIFNNRQPSGTKAGKAPLLATMESRDFAPLPPSPFFRIPEPGTLLFLLLFVIVVVVYYFSRFRFRENLCFSAGFGEAFFVYINAYKGYISRMRSRLAVQDEMGLPTCWKRNSF